MFAAVATALLTLATAAPPANGLDRVDRAELRASVHELRLGARPALRLRFDLPSSDLARTLPPAQCVRLDCELAPPAGLSALSLMTLPPRDLILTVARRVDLDPRLTAAAIFLAESSVQLDLSPHRFYFSFRLHGF